MRPSSSRYQPFRLQNVLLRLASQIVGIFLLRGGQGMSDVLTGEGIRRRIRLFFWRGATLGLAVLVASTGSLFGDVLPPPQGAIILTVTGQISNTTADNRAEFDRAALELLGSHQVRTSTAWTDGVSIFEGPLLCDLLNRVGASGATLMAKALNDYAVEIPIDDCRKYPVVLALKRDGRELQRRDKGPIWIVYPRDDYPELRSEQVNTRWIWQLDRLHVQ
jgi:hypothetical protein